MEREGLFEHINDVDISVLSGAVQEKVSEQSESFVNFSSNTLQF